MTSGTVGHDEQWLQWGWASGPAITSICSRSCPPHLTGSSPT